jgi:hypothetical protein
MAPEFIVHIRAELVEYTGQLPQRDPRESAGVTIRCRSGTDVVDECRERIVRTKYVAVPEIPLHLLQLLQYVGA